MAGSCLGRVHPEHVITTPQHLSAGRIVSGRARLHGSLVPSTNWRHAFDLKRCLRAQVAEIAQRTDTSPLSGDTPPQVDLESAQDGIFTVKGSFQTSLPVSAIWDVITDYNGLSRVYSSVEACFTETLDNRLVVVQDCKWEFWVFSGTFRIRLKVAEEVQQHRLTFTLVDASFMRDFEGQWQLSPLEGGGCHVVYRNTVEPILSPPPLLAGYTEKIFCSQIGSLLQDLQQELAKHAPAHANGSGRQDESPLSPE